MMSMVPSFFGGRRSNTFDPFSLDIWDPYLTGTSDVTSSALANMRMDWKETPEAHVIKADLPGLRKDEIKVEVEDDRVLQISGQRTREQEDTGDKWHRVERTSGSFMRRFRLPDNANMDQIKANMEQGVLTLVVPKIEQRKPQVKAINISD